MADGEFQKDLTDAKRDVSKIDDGSMQNDLVFSEIKEKPEEDTNIVLQNFISKEPFD